MYFSMMNWTWRVVASYEGTDDDQLWQEWNDLLLVINGRITCQRVKLFQRRQLLMPCAAWVRSNHRIRRQNSSEFSTLFVASSSLRCVQPAALICWRNITLKTGSQCTLHCNVVRNDFKGKGWQVFTDIFLCPFVGTHYTEENSRRLTIVNQHALI